MSARTDHGARAGAIGPRAVGSGTTSPPGHRLGAALAVIATVQLMVVLDGTVRVLKQASMQIREHSHATTPSTGGVADGVAHYPLYLKPPRSGQTGSLRRGHLMTRRLPLFPPARYLGLKRLELD